MLSAITQITRGSLKNVFVHPQESEVVTFAGTSSFPTMATMPTRDKKNDLDFSAFY